jgi:hypothetical protein
LEIDWFYKQIQIVVASRGFGVELLAKIGQSKPLPVPGQEYSILLRSGLNFEDPKDSIVWSFGPSRPDKLTTTIAEIMGLEDPDTALRDYDWPFVSKRQNLDPDQYFHDVIIAPSRYHDNNNLEALLERRILMKLLFDRYKDRPEIKFLTWRIPYIKCPWQGMDFLVVKKARSSHYVSYSGPPNWRNITLFLDSFFNSSYPGEFDSRVITLKGTQKAMDYVTDHRPVLIHSFFGSNTRVAEDIDFLSTVNPPEKITFFFELLSNVSDKEGIRYYPSGLYNEIDSVTITSPENQTDFVEKLAEYGIGPLVSTGWTYMKRSEFEQKNSSDSLRIHLSTSYSRKLSMEQRSSMRDIAQLFYGKNIALYFTSYEKYNWPMYSRYPIEEFGRQVYLTAKKGNLQMNETLEEFDGTKIVEFIRAAQKQYQFGILKSDPAPNLTPSQNSLPESDYDREMRWNNFKLVVTVIFTAIPLFLTFRFFGLCNVREV